MKTLLVDADSMVYAIGFMCEGEPEHYAMHNAKKYLHDACFATGCELYEVYIKGKGNFRDEVASYKAQRSSDKPTHYQTIRQYLKEEHMAEEVNGIEVDDKVSILLWQDFCKAEGDPKRTTKVLCGIDKDLRNTPGWHYNPKKQVLDWVSPEQATENFWKQVVTGDAVDNIKGLPGYGPAKAKKVKGKQDALEMYAEYAKQKGWDADIIWEYLCEQVRLLWMLRDIAEKDYEIPAPLTEEDFDFFKTHCKGD